MQSEIEAKFLNVDHDRLRAKLKKLGAVCEHENRLMRRTMFDFRDGRLEQARSRLRIRDEGDKVTVTYKTSQPDSQYHGEIETVIESYGSMEALFRAIGLDAKSYQESKRETWQLQGCEVVLDEWPWIPPYIEIEGPTETAIMDCADRLEFNWEDAVFGSVDEIYLREYPGMRPSESIGAIPRVCFDEPLPDWLRERQR